MLLASLLLPSFVFAVSGLDRCFCFLASDLYQDLWADTAAVLLTTAIGTWWHPFFVFYSQKLNLLFRSFDLASFHDFHPRCRRVLCAVAPEYTIPVPSNKRFLLSSHQQLISRHFLRSRASENVVVAPEQKCHNKNNTHTHNFLLDFIAEQTWCGRGCPFGHFGSAFLAVSPHRILLIPSTHTPERGMLGRRPW